MKYKNRVRRTFNTYYDLRVRIVTKEIDQSVMNKSLFINIIKNLKEIEDRRDFMQDEIGMDMTSYEDKFFVVIEDLFKFSFNKPSIGIIQAFLYETTRPEEWDGTVTLEVGKKGTKTYDLKTPEHLWNIVQILSKD
tara:strand:- start:149 stop:556 length:408 start_codon:yes stop_codon:yes gene_type:complete